MAGEYTPFNSNKLEPTLRDLLDQTKREVFLAMNCHAIAKVQTFNAAEQTIQATINYKKNFNQKQADGTYTQVLVDYPILIDVPVIFLGGGEGAIEPPDPSGSDCLILFNDRDIDNWFAGDVPGPLNSNRLHSFSDGFALIGPRSLTNVNPSYDSTRMTLRYGTTKVACGPEFVLINNAAGNSLGTILGNLMTQLSDLVSAIELITVTCAAPGNPSSPPINAAAFVAIGLQLTAINTQLEGLLE